MYQLLRSLSARQIFGRQVPSLAMSFVIAELFYKFHSFTLECGAFLLTWFALDAAVQGVVRILEWAGGRGRGESPDLSR